jgi:hypothetical protein
MEKHKILQEIDVRIKALEVRRQSSGTGSLIRMSINGGIIELNGFREWLVHVEDTGDKLVHLGDLSTFTGLLNDMKIWRAKYNKLEKSFKRRSFLGFEWYIKTK